MNRLLFVLILFLAAGSLPGQSIQWSEFQAELGRQAALFRDSPEHLQLRARDTRDYNVGDTKVFWRWNLSVMPPTWIQTPATCRGVGEHCYIFVADNQWNGNMTQADVDSALVRLEDRTVNDPTRGAIEMDVSLFGPIPDELDNDPRLIVFYSALGSFQGTSFDGYFSPYNQVTEAQAQQMNPSGHSNECEMIYMTCSPLDPIAPIRLSVLAHELQHLIHWGMDPNEDTWINEGCAELAMVAYGIPDPISGFPSNPDNNLTAWNQTTADYVKVMLFFTYLQEHYDATGLISTLVADPQNGIASIASQIETHFPGQSFADVFSNWGVANITDEDSPSHPLWNYAQLDLPNFTMTNLAVVPALNNATIQPYATDYLKYTCQNEGERLITITCNANVLLKAVNFGYDGSCLSVEDLGVGTSFVVAPPHTNVSHTVVYVLSNPYGNSITYSLSTTVSNDDQAAPEMDWASVSLYPNPFNVISGPARIQYSIAQNQPIHLDVFNTRGQKVRSLEDGYKAAGEHTSYWDGRDDKGKPASPGVYVYRLSSGNKQLCGRMILLSGGN